MYTSVLDQHVNTVIGTGDADIQVSLIPTTDATPPALYIIVKYIKFVQPPIVLQPKSYLHVICIHL